MTLYCAQSVSPVYSPGVQQYVSLVVQHLPAIKTAADTSIQLCIGTPNGMEIFQQFDDAMALEACLDHGCL